MIYLLLSILALLGFYYFCIKPLSFWKKKGVKQGRPLWFFGDTFQKFIEVQSRAELDQMFYNRFPEARYHGIYNFTLPSLYIRDPELIKQILVKDFEYFTDRLPLVAPLVDPLWSSNILQLRGQEWKEIRLLLSPAFTSAKMKLMYNLISDITIPFMENLHKRGKSFDLDIKEMFRRYTNDVIASTAFGVKVDSVTDPKNEFYVQGIEAVKLEFREVLRMAGYWFLGPKFYDIFKTTLARPSVLKFFLTLMNDTITTREKNNIFRPDMLQLLIDARKDLQNGKSSDENKEKKTIEKGTPSMINLTNENIAAHAFVFFFGGFDTVSSMLTFTAYELALNPDIQKRLKDEIFETYKACDGNLTYDALMKMRYMDMVMLESMRKWPNMISFNRACSKAYTIDPILPDENPLHLEEGTTIFLPIYGIHRDPKYFPDPEKFDPERFSEENKGNINPYAYIPFGLGPRNCIGSRFALMEVKTFVFHLLLNFEVYPVEKTQIPIKLSTRAFGLRPEGSLIIGMRSLKQ